MWIKLSTSVIMVSASVNDGESYPGQSFSISQLLYTTRRKLGRTTLGGKYVCTLKMTRVIAQTRFLQDYDDPEPEWGGEKET